MDRANPLFRPSVAMIMVMMMMMMICVQVVVVFKTNEEKSQEAVRTNPLFC